MEPRKAALAFAALSIFFLATTLLWLRLDRSPPTWDDAFYLTGSLKMYDALSDGGLPGYARQFLTVMGSKPPLIAVLPTPVYLLAGRHPRAAYAINLVFLLVMFAALYRMGSRYSGSRAGLLAVYLSGTMPILYGLSHWFLVECGLTAIVCVALCLLSEWNDFAGAWKGFLLGAVCGLGVLMKASFPVYVLIPLIYVGSAFGSALRRLALVAFAASALALAAPWYLFNYRSALGTAISAGSAETSKLYQTGDVLSLASIETYLGSLVNAGPACYFAGLLLLLPVVRKASPAVRRGLFLCAIWGLPVLFLVFGHYRELRYAAPLFPALALALALLIDSALAGRGAAAASVAAGLLLLPLLSMLQTSFGMLGAWRPELGGLLFRAPGLAYAGLYDPAGWPHAAVLSGIYSTARFAGGERKTLLLGTDSVHFNADNFTLAALQWKMPFSIASTAYETDLKSLLPLVDGAAYFVYREGGEPVAPFFNIHGAAALREVRNSGRFIELPLARKLPDGGVVHVFENRSTARAFVSADIDGIPDCDVTFAGKLQLAGLSAHLTDAGLEVKYRWRCLKRVDREYWCFTHILDGRGDVAGYLDHPVLNGDPPMTGWREGDVAMERLLFPLPEASQRGPYRLILGLFHKDSGERLPISSSGFPVTDKRTAAIAPFER